MIVSRAPLRMSFVGGGSDLPSYYRQKGGAVLSTSVDKYMYVTVNKKFDSDIRLSYSVTENESSAQQIKHPIVRNILNFLYQNPCIHCQLKMKVLLDNHILALLG